MHPFSESFVMTLRNLSNIFNYMTDISFWRFSIEVFWWNDLFWDIVIVWLYQKNIRTSIFAFSISCQLLIKRFIYTLWCLKYIQLSIAFLLIKQKTFLRPFIRKMTSTILTTTLVPIDYTNYSLVIPMAIAFAGLAVIVSCCILFLIIHYRRLHTVNHLLIGNTCVWTVFCCFAQSNHYIYLLLITFDTSDMSCRWRGYFAYMTIAGVVYSYLLQSISRLFFIVLAQKYRWIISLKTHIILICIQWIMVIMLASPAILTNDIFFRPHALCWVTVIYPLHNYYTLLVYYALPTIFIVLIYFYVYYRVKNSRAQAFTTTNNNRQQKRDFELFRNILILFGIYLSGGLPTTVYILTRIAIFYPMGLVFVCVTIFVEKATTLFLDREIRDTLKPLIHKVKPRVAPSVT